MRTTLLILLAITLILPIQAYGQATSQSLEFLTKDVTDDEVYAYYDLRNRDISLRRHVKIAFPSQSLKECVSVL